jgi:hypothetical protein
MNEDLNPSGELFGFYQLTGEHHQTLYDMLVQASPDVVITESFTYRRQDYAILTSVEYIGVAKLYCQEREMPLVQQPPSAAKALWTNDKIKRLGLWRPNERHAMDALRHLLYYVTVTMKDNRFVIASRP